MTLDDETLKRMEKCAAQFSTALRTFSKLLVSLRKNGTKIPVYGLDHGPETPDDESSESDAPEFDLVGWLFSKLCVWGPYHNEDVAKFLTYHKYRADRNNNFWKRSGYDWKKRRNWKKVSEATIQNLYTSYTDLVRKSVIVAKQEKDNDSDLWKSIHSGKQSRLFRLSQANNRLLSYKAFVKVMIEHHNDLPALRGT